jgi:signal transduction histidine kinase
MSKLNSSINSIRRRLIMILIRAFGIVVLLTVGLTLITTALRISQESDRNPFYRSPVATILESYYLGHGSWDGVQAVLSENTNPSVLALRPDWQQAVLVDKLGTIILDNGRNDTSRVGKIYSPPVNAGKVFMVVNGVNVGTLYLEASPLPHSWSFVFPLIPSIAVVSFITGLFTLILGILLMNRIVNPLAEVIAASQAVTDGNLAVRVPVRGRKDDLQALSDHFNRMAETLERNDKVRRDLLADIAHELRTPLTILRGRLEGVLDGVYPATKEFIAPALTETYLLERLVDDLRLLTMAEARQLHIELRPVETRELLARVMDLFEAQASEQKITLSLNSDSDMQTVLADPQRLEQVLGNLLDNALRYSSEDSQVEINLHRLDNNIEITVSDTGPGLNEDELPLIFNRFWRSDKSRTRLTGGAGLGLAIVKQLVEAQGGSINATNRPERGLQISLQLPIAQNNHSMKEFQQDS